MAAYWTNLPTEGAKNYQKALALAHNLPEREKLRIQASAESWRGNREGAVVMLRPYLASHPEDLDLWSMLAYNYLRAGMYAEAEEVWKRVTALDSLDHVAMTNLATVQKTLHKYADALVSYRRAFELNPASEVANNNVNLEYGSTYVFNHQPDSARAVFTRLLASPDPLRQARAFRSLAFLDMYQGRFQSAAARLGRAAEMMRASGEGVSEIRNRLLLAQALEQIDAERGVRAQLEAAYDISTKIDAPLPILLWVGKALARAGDTLRAKAALQSMEKRTQADVRTERAARDIMRGEVLVALGRSQEALVHLRAGYAADSQTHALESLANGLAAAGALDSAAARYAQMEGQNVFGFEAQNFAQLAGYWLGRVEEERNSPQSARGAYERFVNRWKDGDPTLVLVADARARIAKLSTSGR
jgi:Tfp pilus assembly protein PilF